MDLIAVFVFYSKASGVQSRLSFSKEFKHCNIVTFDGRDWVMIDFDRSGLLTRCIHTDNPNSLLRTLPIMKEVTAIVTVAISKRQPITWKPYLVRSCNEICRYSSGINIGLTFNPRHLYRKLIQYKDKRNYEVLSHWRRKYGISRRRQRTESK